MLAASIFHDGVWTVGDLKRELANLGVEVRLEQLPIVQKHILAEALRAGRFTITATDAGLLGHRLQPVQVVGVELGSKT